MDGTGAAAQRCERRPRAPSRGVEGELEDFKAQLGEHHCITAASAFR